MGRASGWLLVPLSWLYGAAVRLRRWLYRLSPGRRLPGETISVGNVAIGGTGKTPVVIALARELCARGATPAVLTRGYRSGVTGAGVLVLRDGEVVWRQRVAGDVFPDEAMLQSRSLPGVPIIIGPRRWQAAQSYLASGAQAPSHWLLDDGFQHQQLQRGRDVVLVDPANPDDRLLPAGRLREGLAAVRCADVLVVTRPKGREAETLRRLRQVNSQAPIFQLGFQAGWPLSLEGERLPREAVPIALLTGIARGREVAEQLRDLHGLEVGYHYCGADHRRFPLEPVRAGIARCAAVVTTEKDYWREPEYFARLTEKPVFCVRLEITGDLAALCREIVSPGASLPASP